MTQGSLLGYAWIVIRPLLQTVTYVVVVAYIFRSSSRSALSPWSYTAYVLSGMIPWQILTRSIEEAPSIVRNRMELVKQVIYPIETLPVSGLLGSAIGSLATFTVLLALTPWSGLLHWTWLLLPIPTALLVLFVLGFAWIFMIAGVVIKDLREIASVVLGLLVYASPVIVNQDMVSPRMWRLIQWNPLAHVVICFRDVFQAQFHPASWMIFVLMALITLTLGNAVVTRMKLLINEYL